MRWNFDDERIPLPGDQLITYLRVDDAPGGARVEVHQLVDTPEQASLMYAAWTSILGRLEQGLIEAIRL